MEGYKIGVTTLRSYLREKRRRQAEVYIPLVYRPAEVAQVDFFEVTVEEAGVARKVWKFLMHLMYSRYDFVWLYDRCDQTSFLDGHVRAFTIFGGVPHRLVYDNLSAAVRRFIGNERQLEGATYSVPSGWARLDATAYVGVEDIRICCLGKEVFYPKQRPGIRRVQYCDYLPELARKPQAVRQVAPELIREQGGPFGQ